MEKSTEINLTLSDANFIGWMIARLEYLHGYGSGNEIIRRLSEIKAKIHISSIECSDQDLDKIISKYFVDFYLPSDGSTSIGYTEAQRNNLRNSIKQIVADVRSNNIPKEILLK